MSVGRAGSSILPIPHMCLSDGAYPNLHYLSCCSRISSYIFVSGSIFLSISLFINLPIWLSSELCSFYLFLALFGYEFCKLGNGDSVVHGFSDYSLGP